MIKFLKNNFLYFMLAIGISPLSSNVNGVNVKFPFLILGISLLWLQKKNIKTLIMASFQKEKVRLITIICIFMFVLGCLTGGDILNVLLDFMAIMSFSLFFFMKLNNQNDYYTLEDFALRLSIAITIIELSYMSLGLYLPGEEEHRIINLVICPFFVSMYYLSKRQILLSFIFLIILVYMCIISSMRINFFFPVFYLMELLIIIFQNRQYGSHKKLLIVFSIITSTVIIFPIAKLYIENDHVRYINTVARIEGIYKEDSGFDETARTGTIDAIIDNPLDFIIPQGLGWLNHVKNIQLAYRSKYNVLSSMDSNIMYCVYHFGLFLGLWLICSIISRMIRAFIDNFRVTKHPFLEINNYILASLFLMFILKSWIFVYFSFGLVYGLLSTISLNNRIRNNGKFTK